MSEEIIQEGQEPNLGSEEHVEQSTPQLSADEEKAIARGWVPKEDWVEAGNKEEDWKPAKVFNEHGEMIGKIRAYERKVAEQDRAIQFMHQKSQEVYESGYQAALKQLRQEKREALAEGDLVKADEIDEKIDETRQKISQVRAAPPPAQPQVDPEFVAWVEQNPWYNEGVMQKFADALAIEYINVNKGQVTAADVRDFVEKEVKKEFPHKFKQTPRSAPSPDGDGRGATGKTGGSGRLDSRLAQAKANMTDEERGIMKTMIRSTGMTEQEYLKMYLS